jgi:NlpC/P60 family putative phage cell wall peptidase
MSFDPPCLVAARAWIGTPYVLGAALRGAGCDCVGLLRGVWSDMAGLPPPPAPPWRADWVNSSARPLVTAAREYLDPIPLDQAAPGDAVVLRILGTREAHCGVLERGDMLIHAMEGVGVVRVPFAAYLRGLAFAARFPPPYPGWVP